jgi:aryl-alcohol dehydrogenase-like predicted oxidoreductase
MEYRRTAPRGLKAPEIRPGAMTLGCSSDETEGGRTLS